MKNTAIIEYLVVGIIMFVSSTVQAVTSKDIESLTIYTGLPTVAGESAISASVLWRIDEKMRYSGTGLTFVNGKGTGKPDNQVIVAEKMVTSVEESMTAQEPSWRGAAVEQLTAPGGEKKPALKIYNKQGHSLNAFVMRDYTNQDIIRYIVKPSFSESGVSAAIDLVYIESADGSNPFLNVGKKNSSKKRAKGGGIELNLGTRGSATIETTNLSTEQIEEKIAASLRNIGGYVSSSPLVEDVKDGTTRNVKPFDGNEVQFESLSGNEITVSVKDPSIAAIVKLKYQDENNTMVDVPMPLIIVVLLAVVGGVGYMYWKSQSAAAENQDIV